MARAATGFQIVEIAKRARVATATVVRFEKGEELKPRTIEAIQRAYEAAGVEFINGNAPGIKLHRGTSIARKEKR
jgi:transcriptional regulator with XRE-family HTH domain